MADRTPAEMREYIESFPLPGDGHGPWVRSSGDEGYESSACSLAHAFLVIAEEDPTLLDVPSKEDDPSGFDRADNRKLWDAFKSRWPDGNDWLGGASGFQFGWAHNAVRFVLGAEAVGNPAIVTIGSDA